MTKKIIISLISISIILLIAFLVIFISLNNSLSYDGTISADVASEITIERDPNGLPLINVKTRDGALFALGFLHAQDRLNLIEYYRAIAKGKLSQTTGSKGILIDKISRTIGFERKSDELIKKIPALYSEYLNSYVKGINLFKQKQSEQLFAITEIPEDLWTSKDVLSILLLFEWSAAYLNNLELVFPVPERIYKDSFREIIPEQFQYKYTNADSDNITALKEIKIELESSIGSWLNGYALFISKEKTKDAKSKLCYSLENIVEVYPKWYPVNFNIDGFTLKGVTASGLPFVFAGENKHLAFCGLNVKIDSQIFYKEKTNIINEEMKYFSGGQWKNFESSSEVISIRDESRHLAFSVRRTANGPVISDIFADELKVDVISISDLQMDESYVISLFDIPFTDTLANAAILTRNISSTPKTYIFKSPDEALHLYSGKFYNTNLKSIFIESPVYSINRPVDLSQYQRFIRYENIITGSEIFDIIPYSINGNIYNNDVNRFSRLNTLIEKNNSIDTEYLKTVMHDIHSVPAEKFTQVFLALLENIPVTSSKLSRIYFSNWDFKMDKNSVPAMIYKTLLSNLINETLKDEFPEGTNSFLKNDNLIFENFFSMFNNDRTVLFDDITTTKKFETRDIIFDRAFLKAVQYLNKKFGPIMEDWKWGNTHRPIYSLPLIRNSFIARRYTNKVDFDFKGGGSTIYKGMVDPINDFKTHETTSISIILDMDNMHISMSEGITTNPISIYFKSRLDDDKFINYQNSNDNPKIQIKK